MNGEASSGWLPQADRSRAVALEVLIHGPLSRTEIARRLDLSQPSLTRLSAPLLAAGPAQAAAQAYPTRTVRLVIPFPPGGAADTFGRIVADKLGAGWKQSVLVENRPGAGGQIATEYVAKSAPDGYTLLLVTVGHAVNPSLYPRLRYDTERDFTPVAMLATLLKPTSLPSCAATVFFE